MTCLICGRRDCTESFHSLKEQERHVTPHKTVLNVSPQTAGRMATNTIAYAQEVEIQRDALLKLLAEAISLVSRCDIRQQDAADWIAWAAKSQPILDRCKEK